MAPRPRWKSPGRMIEKVLVLTWLPGHVVFGSIGDRGELQPPVSQLAGIGGSGGGGAGASESEAGAFFDIPLDLAVAVLAGAGDHGVDGVALFGFDGAVAVGVGGVGVGEVGGDINGRGGRAFEVVGDRVGGRQALSVGDGEAEGDGVAVPIDLRNGWGDEDRLAAQRLAVVADGEPGIGRGHHLPFEGEGQAIDIEAADTAERSLGGSGGGEGLVLAGVGLRRLGLGLGYGGGDQNGGEECGGEGGGEGAPGAFGDGGASGE